MTTKMKNIDLIFIGLFALILILGVVGNSLVIYAFKSKKRSLTAMELVIFYLALTDLITSIFNPPLYMYWHVTGFSRWDFGEFSCTLFPSIITVSVTMSLGLIQLITVERCKVLVNPLINKLFTKKHLHGWVVVVLLVSILNELPYIVNNTVHPVYDTVCTMHPNVSQSSKHPVTSDVDGFNSTRVKLLSKKEKQQTKDFLTKGGTKNREDTKLSSNGTATSKKPPIGTVPGQSSKYNITKINLLSPSGQTSVILQHRLCNQSVKWVVAKYCGPNSTTRYKYSRIATILLRDIVFVVTLVVCNILIYRSLKDPEHKTQLMHTQARLDPGRTLRMLLLNAIVFVVLVLPKDIFTVVYTISTLTGSPMESSSAIYINSGLKLIQKCNSIVNIFIYARLHASFKETMDDTIIRISTF